MAVTLFIDSMTTLATELRMGNVYDTAGNEASTAIIDRAVQEARVLLYKELGSARVDKLLSTLYTEAGTTTAQLNRMQANNVESLAVRYMIAKSYPVFYIDKIEDATAAYSDDITTRQASPYQQAVIIDRLRMSLQEAIALLKNEEDMGEFVSECDGKSVGPDDDAPLFDSFWRG